MRQALSLLKMNWKKRDDIRAIELKLQADPSSGILATNLDPLTEDLSNPKKFMGTFPFPYVNGPLHLGHASTLCKVDFACRYKKLQGENVLFPFAFHASGMPIVAAAQRLREELRSWPPAGTASLSLVSSSSLSTVTSSEKVGSQNYALHLEQGTESKEITPPQKWKVDFKVVEDMSSSETEELDKLAVESFGVPLEPKAEQIIFFIRSDSTPSQLLSMACLCLEEGEVCFLRGVCTQKSSHNQGCATAIINRVIAYVDEIQFHRVELWVRPENSNVIRLYEKLGFSLAPDLKLLETNFIS